MLITSTLMPGVVPEMDDAQVRSTDHHTQLILHKGSAQKQGERDKVEN